VIYLLAPVLHAGALGWDELLLILIGLIVLAVIALSGGKRDKPPAEAAAEPSPDEQEP
jgi:hypothetical protein